MTTAPFPSETKEKQLLGIILVKPELLKEIGDDFRLSPKWQAVLDRFRGCGPDSIDLFTAADVVGRHEAASLANEIPDTRRFHELMDDLS